MTSKSQLPDGGVWEPLYKNRGECLTMMVNKSSTMPTPYCPPDWERYTEMCWAPTPAGETAFHPCPDDGYLNPNEFATRTCLSDGTWYINYTLDDKPFTNFTNCLLPLDPSAEDDLKKFVDKRIIFILKSLDEYKRSYLAIYGVSAFLLIVSLSICFAMVYKLKQKRQPTLSFITVIIATAALIIINSVAMSVSAVDDATKILKCRGAKWLVLFSTLVFQESVLGYLLLCIMSILQITIKPLIPKSAATVAVSVTFILVTTEILLETFSCSTRYCGFRTLQSTFHWLTTTPRLLLIMVNFCVGSVTVFGVICLRQPHLAKRRELWHIRQRSVSLIVLVLYSVILEILLVLIHTEAYMDYADLPMHEYLNAFSFATAALGIVFSVLMCFSDLGVLEMFGIALSCFNFSTRSERGGQKALQMYPVSRCQTTEEHQLNENEDTFQSGQLSVDSSSVDLVQRSATGGNPTDILWPADPQRNIISIWPAGKNYVAPTSHKVTHDCPNYNSSNL